MVIGRTTDRMLSLRPLWLFTKEIAVVSLILY